MIIIILKTILIVTIIILIMIMNTMFLIIIMLIITIIIILIMMTNGGIILMIIIIMVVAWWGPLQCPNHNPANDNYHLILDNDKIYDYTIMRTGQSTIMMIMTFRIMKTMVIIFLKTRFYRAINFLDALASLESMIHSVTDRK